VQPGAHIPQIRRQKSEPFCECVIQPAGQFIVKHRNACGNFVQLITRREAANGQMVQIVDRKRD
jgi:hypothetical protein